MPALRNYKIFISHAWSYSDDYLRIVKFLNNAPNLIWTNLSVPQHNPIANKERLEAELRNQMRPADVFLILGGMYVSHSDWIKFEIDFAWRIGRPIVGIQPWGSVMMPLTVQQASKEIVGWNSNSIVNAIRSWALPSNVS